MKYHDLPCEEYGVRLTAVPCINMRNMNQTCLRISAGCGDQPGHDNMFILVTGWSAAAPASA